MDEYIKREDALDAVLFALVGTGYQSRAIYAIRDVPTADVAPKSEVAMEIFAEIEQEILSAIDNNLQRMAEQEEANEIWRMCVAKKNTLCGIYDFLAELKKKYTEEGNDGT